MGTRLLLLLLSGALALTETWAGTHTLKIFSTAVYCRGGRKSRYIGVSYADNAEIAQFDSDAPNPRLELRAPWMEKERPDYWNQGTGFCLREAQINQANLNKLRANYKHSEDREPRVPGSRSPPPSPRTHGPLSPQVSGSECHLQASEPASPLPGRSAREF
ncbi:class I histocompatibility antigen, Gogo-C*0202 alpha chain-like [Phyllostomus discolor]|uniref:Class I histocompatibility antigen, Gogo-C*0202 alpha chain-like n=1 Tax=Phyllostomus discolor TaxID=89673 RepID=A0A7E6CR07_9CHIR|nr:class I histocompatibility antigen, Gogo-C*0202 alpha chain-like [Phyllostomus discolor]